MSSDMAQSAGIWPIAPIVLGNETAAVMPNRIMAAIQAHKMSTKGSLAIVAAVSAVDTLRPCRPLLKKT
jgi:hypothetical protein